LRRGGARRGSELAKKLRCNYNVGMSEIVFQWDERKAVSNKRKHSVGFEEARTVFLDEKARVIFDPDHSKKDERFIILGLSVLARLLTVCHCYS